MLVIDSNADRAKAIVEAVRARGAKAILAQRPSVGVGLAREHRPEVILVAEDPGREESALGKFKRRPDTRHTPIVVLGDRTARLSAFRAGAAAFVDEPAGAIDLDRALARVARLTEGQARRIAVIADDSGAGRSGHRRARRRR